MFICILTLSNSVLNVHLHNTLCHLPLPYVKIGTKSMNKTKRTIKTETRLSTSQIHVWVGQQCFLLKIFHQKCFLFFRLLLYSRSSGKLDQKFQVEMTKNYSKKTTIHIIKEENGWRHLSKLCAFCLSTCDLLFIYVINSKVLEFSWHTNEMD